MGRDPEPRANWRRLAVRVLLVVGGAYFGIALMLVLLENWLVFRPVTAAEHWPTDMPARVEDVFFTSADGTRLHAWWLPSPGADKALLFCHGNGGNLTYSADCALELRKTLGVNVLIFDYPGYGKSGGSPTEQGCYQAADAGYDWLINEKKLDPKKLLLFGDSLGGGVAVNLAGRREHAALLLVRTYTTLPDVGGHVYPWLPVRWLMRNRFDSLGKIASCHQPLFVAHGTADTLIPNVLGRQLFDAANEPKCYCDLPDADHNDSLPTEFYVNLREFLATQRLLDIANE